MADDAATGALKTVFSGALLILFGFVAGGVLTLGVKVVVARLFGGSVYGLFSEALSFIYIMTMVSLFGLNVGISRFISFYQEKNDAKSDSAVTAAFLVTVPIAVLCFLFLYLFAADIASFVGHSGLSQVLRIMSIAGPFMVANAVFISGFRGRQRAVERVVVLDFLIPSLQLFGIGVAYWYSGTAAAAFAGFVSSFIIAFIGTGSWYWLREGFSLETIVFKELVVFSWPLMVSAVAMQVFMWIPSIILGYFVISSDVGVFNAALPLAASSKMFLSAVAFLMMPVCADLFSRRQYDAVKPVYRSTVKWLVIGSAPVLAFMLFFPALSVSFFFGQGFAAAAPALTILAIGYLVNLWTGPAGEILIASGRTRHEMVANVLKLSLFLVLAFVLTPVYGVTGTASSYAIAMIVGNLLRFALIYDVVGWPYTRGTSKPIVTSILSTAAVAFIGAGFVVSVIVFVAVYALVLSFVNPLDDTDTGLVRQWLEERGIKNTAVTTVIRFLSGGGRDG